MDLFQNKSYSVILTDDSINVIKYKLINWKYVVWAKWIILEVQAQNVFPLL